MEARLLLAAGAHPNQGLTLKPAAGAGVRAGACAAAGAGAGAGAGVGAGGIGPGRTVLITKDAGTHTTCRKHAHATSSHACPNTPYVHERMNKVLDI